MIDPTDASPSADAAPPPSAPHEAERPAVEVILIEDDRSLLQLLRYDLEAAGHVVHGFDNALDALMFASDSEPCCLVTDLKIPGVEGLDLVAALQALDRHAVILVSAYVDVSTTVDAMRLGVEDVLVKPVSSARLIDAVERAAKQLAERAAQDHAALTRRERQVAEGLVAGRTTKQIAQELGLSPRTIEFFRASLLRKTQSRNTAALVAALMRIGYGHGGDA